MAQTSTIQARPIDSGACNPKAARLALRHLTGEPHTRLATLHGATAGVRILDGLIGDHPARPIVWGPDVLRVFSAEATGSRSRMATRRVEAPGPTAIRVAEPPVPSLAATTP